MPGCFYEGEWVKGKQQGYGTITTVHGVSYTGNFVQGAAQGEDGILVSPDGSIYRGKFENNVFQGKGRFHYFVTGTTY